MKIIKILSVLLCTILLTQSCAPTRLIIPLKRKQQALGVAAGGPITTINNITTPLPLSSVTHYYGWQRNTTIHNSLHLSSLFNGTFHLESGIVSRVWSGANDKLGVSISPSLNFMTDLKFQSARLYPQFDVNGYWYITGKGGKSCDCPGTSKNKPLLLYAGVSNWIDFNFSGVHNIDQNQNFLPHPNLGLLFMDKSYRIQLEAKWIHPMYDNSDLLFNFTGIENQGAIGTFISFTKILNHAN